MRNRTQRLPLAALALGLLGAALRALQMCLGFEPDTGLSIQGSWLNLLVPVFLAAVILVMLAPIWSPGTAGMSFGRCFRPVSRRRGALLAAGAFLFLISGGLYFLRYMRGGGMVLDLVLGAFAACLTVSQLYALRRWREEGMLEGVFLLPPVVFFLLSLTAAYLAHGTFPVPARYSVEILAMAALAYGFYQVAAAGYRQGAARALCRGLGLGVSLGLTAAATLADLAESLSMAAGALILLAYGFSLTKLNRSSVQE